MPTVAEIAAYSAANNYPVCGVTAYVQAHSRLPSDAAALCQWASANGVLDPVSGQWLCSDAAPASGIGEWIRANPMLAAGIGLGAYALLKKNGKRR